MTITSSQLQAKSPGDTGESSEGRHLIFWIKGKEDSILLLKADLKAVWKSWSHTHTHNLLLSQTYTRVHAHLQTHAYTHAWSHKHECKLVAVCHSLLSVLTLGSVPALLACHLCDQCNKNMFLSKQGRSWKEGCGPFHPHPSPASTQKNSSPCRSRNRLEPVSTLWHLTECLTWQKTRC